MSPLQFASPRDIKANSYLSRKVQDKAWRWEEFQVRGMAPIQRSNVLPLTIVHIYYSRILQLDENGTAVSMDKPCALSRLSFDLYHPEQTFFNPS